MLENTNLNFSIDPEGFSEIEGETPTIEYIPDEPLEGGFNEYIADDNLKEQWLNLTTLQKAIVDYRLGLSRYKSLKELADGNNVSVRNVYFQLNKSKKVQAILHDIADVNIADWAGIIRAMVAQAQKGNVPAAAFVAKYCPHGKEGSTVKAPPVSGSDYDRLISILGDSNV